MIQFFYILELFFKRCLFKNRNHELFCNHFKLIIVDFYLIIMIYFDLLKYLVKYLIYALILNRYY